MLDSVWTAAVGSAFACWLLASVVHQFRPTFWRRLARHDRMRLLPAWHFFAPNPARRDHHLVFRDVVESRIGPWREIEVGCGPRPARWLWNPPRFRQKALGDFVNSLLVARRLVAEAGAEERGLLLSAPYLGLLTWVLAQDAEQRPCSRQFAVVSSQGHDGDRGLHLVYVSELHLLPGPPGAD